MTILADHMTRRVSIAVFCIIVSTLVQQGLEDLRVATDACNVEWCTQVLGLAVEVSAELGEDLDHLDMPFITRHVQRRPPIRITLIQQRLGKLGILLNQ